MNHRTVFDDTWSRFFSFCCLFFLLYFSSLPSYLSSLNALNTQCHLRPLSINQHIILEIRPLDFGPPPRDHEREFFSMECREILLKFNKTWYWALYIRRGTGRISMAREKSHLSRVSQARSLYYIPVTRTNIFCDVL